MSITNKKIIIKFIVTIAILVTVLPAFTDAIIGYYNPSIYYEGYRIMWSNPIVAIILTLLLCILGSPVIGLPYAICVICIAVNIQSKFKRLLTIVFFAIAEIIFTYIVSYVVNQFNILPATIDLINIPIYIHIINWLYYVIVGYLIANMYIHRFKITYFLEQYNQDQTSIS